MELIFSVATGFLVLAFAAWLIRRRVAERQARLVRLDSVLVDRILSALHSEAENNPDEPGVTIRQLQSILEQECQADIIKLSPGKQYERLREELKFLIREDLVEIYIEDEDYQWDTTYVLKAPVA